MLLALYERGTLRADIIELLKTVKSKDVFIIAVNTLKINPASLSKDLVDVYIEKENFGRDFSSYQTGMKYIYNSKISDTCERLLMLNDSVFYSVKGLNKFINDLYNTDIDVLGATENHYMSRHLGSFCISITGDIIRSSQLKTFWENYKLSNVRPVVIHRGEFVLSRTLKSLARNDDNFKALYNASRFEKDLSQDDNFLKNYHYFCREGVEYIYGSRLTFKDDYIFESFYQKYLRKKKRNMLEEKLSMAENEPDYHDEKYEKNLINYLDFSEFLEQIDFGKTYKGHVLKERLVSRYLDEFIKDSQIHNNCIVLHYMGLPIIKLDLHYRMVCNYYDIVKIRQQLDSSQQEQFMALFTGKPDGKRFLTGINRIAFHLGILW